MLSPFDVAIPVLLLISIPSSISVSFPILLFISIPVSLTSTPLPIPLLLPATLNLVLPISPRLLLPLSLLLLISILLSIHCRRLILLTLLLLTPLLCLLPVFPPFSILFLQPLTTSSPRLALLALLRVGLCLLPISAMTIGTPFAFLLQRPMLALGLALACYLHLAVARRLPLLPPPLAVLPFLAPPLLPADGLQVPARHRVLAVASLLREHLWRLLSPQAHGDTSTLIVRFDNHGKEDERAIRH
mmetsp:Transcript_68487/g.151650  ORF Transcript_68487/g.151650 Transcript_68487/m.151650 type:complete len:245 (-) Transcript_68487:10-744(-)